MKYLQFLSLVAALALSVGCASDEQMGRTGQREQANREAAKQNLPSTEQQNLQNAQRDVVNRDGNPARGRGY